MENTRGEYAVLRQRERHRVQKTSGQSGIRFAVWEFNLTHQDEKGIWADGFSIPMLSRSLGYSDIVFIVAQLQLYFEAGYQGLKKKDIVNFDKNNLILKSKTLYLSEDQVEGNKDKVIESFDGKIVFVTGEELEKKIVTRSADCLFISYLFSDVKHSDVFVIVDAASMQVRGISGPGEFSTALYTKQEVKNNNENNREPFFHMEVS